MRRWLISLLIIVLFSALILGILPFLFEKGNIENSLTISERLADSYSLEELRECFGTIPYCEARGYGNTPDNSKLSLEKVHGTFPIQYIRKNGYISLYTVYRVAEGGCFYVFWSRYALPFSEIQTSDTLNVFAYYTVYITELPALEDFSEIKPGISTAEDISMITNVIEITFNTSTGPRSYCLLEGGNTLEIQYENNNHYTSRQDLIVKAISILPKEQAQAGSHLANIQEEDLP